MKYFFITNCPEIARYVSRHGVARIFVDLEINGKEARQGHLSTVISRHAFEDIAPVRSAIGNTELLVRLNPLYAGSQEEIDRAIALGADWLMLPMFQQTEEVAQFCDMIQGRARFIPLVETPSAVQALKDVVRIKGVDELYIGLNDLHLALGQRFMFEPLANGMLEEIAGIIRTAGLPFGFGGIARAGEGLLPAEFILGEHARLGSARVILSRTFHRQARTLDALIQEMDFSAEIEQLNRLWANFKYATPDELEFNRQRVNSIITGITQA